MTRRRISATIRIVAIDLTLYADDEPESERLDDEKSQVRTLPFLAACPAPQLEERRKSGGKR